MADPQNTTKDIVIRVPGWFVLVPVLAIPITLLTGFEGLQLPLSLVLLIGTFMGARALLFSWQFGLLWRVLTTACAMAVSLPATFWKQSYVALTGESINASVIEEIDVTSLRISDPRTGEDLGVLDGPHPELEVGSSVEVLVSRGVDLPPLATDRADLAVTAASLWMAGWVVGAGLLLIGIERRRRQAASTESPRP